MLLALAHIRTRYPCIFRHRHWIYPLDGVDLRDAKIEGIVVAPDNLRNVTVDLFQAAYLAGLMGLIIK